jgi:hypothetical protein
MSMLTFYINRAGKELDPKQKSVRASQGRIARGIWARERG